MRRDIGYRAHRCAAKARCSNAWTSQRSGITSSGLQTLDRRRSSSDWTARRSAATPGSAPGRRRRHELPDRGGRAASSAAGSDFSHVTGTRLPPRPPLPRPELAGRSFEAMGVSLVLHPRNPYVPDGAHERAFLRREKAGASPVWWFGGGMDLTPYYGFAEDARALPPHVPRLRSSPSAPICYPTLQEVVRRIFLPQAPRRAARHRRHLLRRPRRARFRHLLRLDAQRRRPLSAGLPADRRAPREALPTASASAISRPIAAGATSSSTWCTTAARCSGCSRAAAPNRS